MLSTFMSSLFSFLTATCFLLTISHSAIGQCKTDSSLVYRNVLLNPNIESDIESAFAYFEKGVLEDLKNHDTIGAVNKLRIISNGQMELGAVYESEATIIKAKKLIEKLPITPMTREARWGIYSSLGQVYRNIDSYNNAIQYYEKGLIYSRNAIDSLMLINNKANVLVDMGKFDLAQKEFETAYKKSENLSDKLIQARVLDNWGYAQSKSYNPDGLENMLRALELRKESNDLRGIYSSYRHLALHYYDRNQDEEALDYAEKAYKLAKTINSPSFIENSLTNLLKVKKDPISSEFIALTDSIKLAKLQIQNKYSAMQYNIAKEKEKTEANRLLQEQEKRKRQVYQFIGILLIIALIALYYIQKAISRKNLLQQIYKTETRISKKVHDEVANDVYHLMNKIHLKIREHNTLLDDLEEIYKKTRDISRENSELTIEEDFSNQLSNLLHSYQSENTRITIQNISKVNWKSVSNLKKTSIYRVLQELMTNMKKHSESTQVLLSFEQNRGKIQIKYRDNGVGCHIKNKNGLQNAENRIKAMKGNINFDSSPRKGFLATITI